VGTIIYLAIPHLELLLLSEVKELFFLLVSPCLILLGSSSDRGLVSTILQIALTFDGPCKGHWLILPCVLPASLAFN
jgi:hypothetical protein